MSPNYQVEFDLDEGVITYREGLRRVRLACAWSEDWTVDAASAPWWEQGEFREAVSAADREEIVRRVVGAALHEHRVKLRVDRPPVGAIITVPADSGAYQIPKTPEQVRTILNWIAEALAFITPQDEAGLEPAQSIARQLRWCRGVLLGEAVETPPGPLTMGRRASREYDHFGSDPEFAELVWKIQDAMEGR
jgi:hypothetical protein